MEENSFMPISNDRFSKVFCLGFSHQIVPYVKHIGSFAVYIDVNFDIFWGEYDGKKIPIDEFLSETVQMHIHNCDVKTLSHIKFFIYTILHHYKDLNSIYLLSTQKTVKVSMFKDLYYYFINNIDNLPLDEVISYCTEYNIKEYVFYVLYYTCIVFDNDDLKQYRDALKTTKGMAILNKYGLTEKEQREWNIDFYMRLNAGVLFDYIKDELTPKELQNIEINKRIFEIN